ncbi:XRE family transcriptional regulator [Nocardia sp. NPDC057227]|uniref:XRE family transcriptional regulator n=1 Tax=Nocardia sp. NPDC057227 TaxID=3346056 RepID=UPI003645D5EE
MANWLGLTQAQLSRIEKGAAPDQISKLIRWAEILDVPRELLWFELPGIQNEGVVPGGLHDAVALARWLIADGAGPLPSSRCPDDLQQVGQALADAHRYFDGNVVEFFRQQLARCKAADGSLGPSEALPLTLALIGAIRQHVRDVRPTIRQQLLALGADGAEFAGSLYRDLHDPVTATFLYDRSMEWAQAAGSLPMQGYVLLKKSQMAYETGDIGTLRALARAADEGPWQLPARIKAEVVQQEALGRAMLGEPFTAVKHKLDVAEQMLSTAAVTTGEPLISYFDQDTFRLRAAVCHTEAGRPQIAAQLFGQVLTSGSLSRRDTGFFGARQAKALALSGEPDEAARVAVRSVGVARETRSERTINVVVEVVRALDCWRHRSMVRQLSDVLQP